MLIKIKDLVTDSFFNLVNGFHNSKNEPSRPVSTRTELLESVVDTFYSTQVHLLSSSVSPYFLFSCLLETFFDQL